MKPVATDSRAASGGSGQWWASRAQRLTTGNGINSAVSLWRAPDDERAELRLIVPSQGEAVDATGAWLLVDGDMLLLDCSRIEASFLRTEGFRSCFTNIPGIDRATTVSRCRLDWEASERMVVGASVELQIGTELKLLKRKRLSKRQLTRL